MGGSTSHAPGLLLLELVAEVVACLYEPEAQVADTAQDRLGSTAASRPTKSPRQLGSPSRPIRHYS
jgi:hypothetical protein